MSRSAGPGSLFAPWGGKKNQFFSFLFSFFILFQTKVKAFNWFYASQIGKEEMHKCQ